MEYQIQIKVKNEPFLITINFKSSKPILEWKAVTMNTTTYRSTLKRIYKSISLQMTILPFCEGVMAIQSLAFFLIYSKHFKISLLNYSMIETVMTMLSCLNPVMGHLSDKFSLFGSKKKSYLLLCSIIGTIGYIICSLSGVLKLNVATVLSMEILIHLTNSFRHLLVDSLCVILHNVQKFMEAPANHKSSTSSVAKLFGNRILGKIAITLIIGVFYDTIKEKGTLISVLRICLLFAVDGNNGSVFD